MHYLVQMCLMEVSITISNQHMRLNNQGSKKILLECIKQSHPNLCIYDNLQNDEQLDLQQYNTSLNHIVNSKHILLRNLFPKMFDSFLQNVRIYILNKRTMYCLHNPTHNQYRDFNFFLLKRKFCYLWLYKMKSSIPSLILKCMFLYLYYHTNNYRKDIDLSD